MLSWIGLLPVEMMKILFLCVFTVFFPYTITANKKNITCETDYGYHNDYSESEEQFGFRSYDKRWYIGTLTYVCSDNNQIDITKDEDESINPCSNLGYLSRFDKNTVKVTKISFENCTVPQMEFAFLDTYTNVEKLDVSHMGLERFDEGTFNAISRITIFDASHNNITEIPKLLFLSADNLVEVNLSHNKIKQLNNLAFSDVVRLIKLDFSYNHFEKIEADYFQNNDLNLQHLSLSHNKIDEIAVKAFANLRSLRFLDLSFNNIKRLNKSMFEGLERLQHLTMQKLSNEMIHIEPLTFVGLNDLQVLDLSLNYIAVFEHTIFDGLRKNSIIELNMSCDRWNNRTIVISKETFDHFTHLRYLNLANNPISTLNIGTFSKLEHLQRLNLSNINLRDITLGTFSRNRNLRILDLSRNQLKIFDFGLFLPRNSELESIYLNENRLIELEGFSSTVVPSLNYLGLTGNNFNCSY